YSRELIGEIIPGFLLYFFSTFSLLYIFCLLLIINMLQSSDKVCKGSLLYKLLARLKIYLYCFIFYYIMEALAKAQALQHTLERLIVKLSCVAPRQRTAALYDELYPKPAL